MPHCCHMALVLSTVWCCTPALTEAEDLMVYAQPGSSLILDIRQHAVQVSSTSCQQSEAVVHMLSPQIGSLEAGCWAWDLTKHPAHCSEIPDQKVLEFRVLPKW